jgi:hypothetical protein
VFRRCGRLRCFWFARPWIEEDILKCVFRGYKANAIGRTNGQSNGVAFGVVVRRWVFLGGGAEDILRLSTAAPGVTVIRCRLPTALRTAGHSAVATPVVSHGWASNLASVIPSAEASVARCRLPSPISTPAGTPVVSPGVTPIPTRHRLGVQSPLP